MAPTPSSKSNQMAHTPSSKSNQTHLHNPKTPHSKNRLNFNMSSKPSPNPNPTAKENPPPAEHPVEVIGRIRDYPDRRDKPEPVFKINPDLHSLRVRTEIGYRDFSLDGVSLSEEEDLDGFYQKFVESRIKGVKLGAKCTIMMYGPTGSGKSHTMFGCAKQPGIVYRSLKDILGEGDGRNDGSDEQCVGVGTFVQVTVLEIYNEEIYDLLSTNNGGGGLSFPWSKGSASKVRLEVMGKKAKNATFISGTEATKISKEIQKVEKRRIVKSTLCNERSSRSHCMIILDVPTVGGRLMLVDMAGSENIEQAGQNGLEAKMQTGKINQGNIALKRVVESIANGDSHVPFRDSKLTMLLQDSFEDDKSKILMILCASPDPKEMHKTISTLEYGAKAKCIVRGPHTPAKDRNEDSTSAVILGSRITAMDQFIFKLQMENKLREKERNEAHKELMKKEEEVSALRAKLATVEGRELGKSEEEINLKVNERTQMLKCELEKKIQECEKMASEFVEMERRKMEEKVLQQQQELEMLRRRLEEIESELRVSRDRNGEISGSAEMNGSGFAKRLFEIYADEDPGMEKSMDLVRSMDLDMGRQEPIVHDVKYFDSRPKIIGNDPNMGLWDSTDVNMVNDEDHDVFSLTYANKVSLSTVFEEGEEIEEEQEEEKEKSLDEEVQKEVIEEKTVDPSRRLNFATSNVSDRIVQNLDYFRSWSEEKNEGLGLRGEMDDSKDTDSFRRMRIQNIHRLCGNYREVSSQHSTSPVPVKKRFDSYDPHSSPVRTIGEDNKLKLAESHVNKIRNSDDSKENYSSLQVRSEPSDDMVEVYVKWEVSKEHQGKFITTLKVVKDATLADLRKLIEIHLGAEFTFLVLGDPTGAPVAREEEATVPVSKLPICNQLRCHLACLRPVKGIQAQNHHIPFTSMENILNVTAR
ncbi:kinesin-like protein KIN-10A [Rhododendron vialii]|uniref:kinesin-like protein KIN-10A n=1 Tax=Rhododendron vialii TaxID=182163 RepID=UPI00265E8B4D|nr:kinesin-like protein KIN-10A [Rhododendron vialii]